MVVYPIIFRVSYIPGGAGLLPSTVSLLRADYLFDVYKFLRIENPPTKNHGNPQPSFLLVVYDPYL